MHINDLAVVDNTLVTKQNKAWNTIGHFSGTQTLNITNALAYDEIQIIARMTPPNAYVTKLSDIYRGGDFANEKVDFMIALGASFGGTFGIGVLCKYSWRNKTLAIDGAYYNTAIDTQNVTVFVYAR